MTAAPGHHKRFFNPVFKGETFQDFLSIAGYKRYQLDFVLYKYISGFLGDGTADQHADAQMVQQGDKMFRCIRADGFEYFAYNGHVLYLRHKQIARSIKNRRNSVSPYG